ncbi:MAG TPA: (5-formylfuran-3-yl)methyl phosphate synthase [Burkholderiaceae bacterium]|nr:(5-formylfuran-3-yl)methyl phosphate synthase [Burkholderiaceae bacterium]
MTALLASVRTEQEAVAAVRAGADIVDLKDPHSGALGALPRALIESIVARVRALGAWPISATIGDLDDRLIDEMVRRVGTTAATGVDFVKVGIAPGKHARAALASLAELPAAVVPLFFADAGLDLALVATACAHGFRIVMVDTANKSGGSLFECVDHATLRRMLDIVHAAGARAGLAGSLRLGQVPALCSLQPDIAGFRGALCDGARTGRLDPEKVRRLRSALPRAEVIPALPPERRGAAATAPRHVS